MHWLQAIAIGVVLGLVTGWAAQRVLPTPLVQSVAAFLVALIIGNLSTLVWWERQQGGSGYFGFGIDNLVYLGILCVGAIAVHAGLTQLGTVWFPALGSYRAVILGCAGGLWGTLSSAWAMTALGRGTI